MIIDSGIATGSLQVSGSFSVTGSSTLQGNVTVSGSITPGGLAYDLGTVDAPWKELYVSTGSINFVNNGTVVSTLGAGTNGTQITGSLLVTSGSIRLSNLNTVNSQYYTLNLNISQSRSYIYSSGSRLVLQHDGQTAINQPVLINTKTTYFTGGADSTYPGCVVIGGSTGSNGGAGLFFAPGNLENVAPDWGITTDTGKNLTIASAGGFYNSNLKLSATDVYTNPGDYDIKLSGADASFMPSASALINLGTTTAAWNNLYTSRILSSDDDASLKLQYDGTTALDKEVLINCPNGLSLSNYPAALVVSGISDSTYGGMIALTRGDGGTAEWAFANDNNRNLLIGNYNQFFNKSIRFNYSASADNIIFSGSAILPGTANHYDLGSAALPWKELYVSTGSINFVNNGTVVSTLGAGTNGTQMTGSLSISGSIVVSPAGGLYKASITAYSGSATNNSGLKIASSGSQIAIFSTGSAASAIFLGIDPRPAVGQPIPVDASVAINTYSNEYGPGSLIIGGPKDGSRGGLLSFHSFANSEWTISQTADVTNNLVIEVNGYSASTSELLLKPAEFGTNTYNVKINQYGILPEPADSGNTYDLGSETAPWDNTWTNSLELTPQTEPANPVAGQIYFNTSTLHFYGYNGTIWKQLDN